MAKRILLALGFVLTAAFGWTQSYYQLGSIPFAPDSTQAGQNVIINQDDVWSGMVALPFQFCFHDTLFTKMWLGSNGQITFTQQNPGSYCPWPINSAIPDANNPPYTILGPWHDINPSFGGSVKYQVLGVPPYRRAVITWYQNAMFSCTSSFTTQQIKLFETTNIIEMHIIDKPLCATWNGGASIQGILINDSLAYVVPGRNYPTLWSAQNEAHAFVPVGNCSGANPLYSVSGRVYADVNPNCTFDTLVDYPVLSRAIVVDGGQHYTWTDTMGRFGIVLQPGLHTITEYVPQPYFASTCTPGAQYQVNLTGLPITGLEFADSGNYACSDLQVGISSPGIHRCDTSDIIYISYENQGLLPDSNVTITVQLHDSIQPYAASIPYTTTGPNTYTFAIGTLNPTIQGVISLFVRVGCAPVLTVYCLNASIQGNPGFDCNGYNNQDQSCLPLNAPADPNSKSVASQDFALRGYIATDTITDTDSLLYRVDFQNIGTAPAQTVEVVDAIDTTHLDITTLQIVAASHPYQYLISGNELIVRFPGIQLPDSNTDEPGSHGYFRYRIQQRPGNPPGTTITNQALIHFDQEAPILTNITHNIIPLPATSVHQPWPTAVRVHPNPGTDALHLDAPAVAAGELHLQDLTGRTLTIQPITQGKAIVPTGHLPAGVYLYSVYDGGRRVAAGRWVRE